MPQEPGKPDAPSGVPAGPAQEAVLLLRRYLGKAVTSADGQRVGYVEDLFLSAHTSLPHWLAVRRSHLSRYVTPVPLGEARISRVSISMPYAARDVRRAPTFPRHHGLTRREADRVDTYWAERDSHAGC